MKANTNVLEGLKCPVCDSLGPFRITCTTTAVVSDSGVEETQDHEWDDLSDCACEDCGHGSTIAAFKTES